MSRLSPFLEDQWPHLLSEGYKVTSEKTLLLKRGSPPYNCIAFAAGVTNQWWWPDQAGVGWWPIAEREVTLDCFVAAYQTLGYAPCFDGTLEDGFEKVVIYMLNGEPTHAARQLSNGQWTSKLGQHEDIEHNSTKAVEESVYGKAVRYLKRSQSQS